MKFVIEMKFMIGAPLKKVNLIEDKSLMLSWGNQMVLVFFDVLNKYKKYPAFYLTTYAPSGGLKNICILDKINNVYWIK